MGDRVLEVITHPRADDGRVGVVLSDRSGHLGQPFECDRGGPVERRDRHHASEAQAIGSGDGVGKAGYRIGRCPAAGVEVVLPCYWPVSVATEIYLDQAADIASGNGGRPREHGNELGAIDGVDEVGVTRDGLALVGLQLADEVPHE
jgi:hypothetical protein